VIVEVFTFRLAPEMSEPDFLLADARVQTDFYYRRPGIVRRTTARAGDDWCVVVFWDRMDDALAAAEAARDDLAAIAFGSYMDRGSISVTRYETLD
jgi:hypothetical protein